MAGHGVESRSLHVRSRARRQRRIQRRPEMQPRRRCDTDAEEAITDARLVSKQLAEGLELLLSDTEALRCFRFMNQVMADQRIHTQIAERRSKDPNLSRVAAREQVLGDGPRAHSWRPFQQPQPGLQRCPAPGHNIAEFRKLSAHALDTTGEIPSYQCHKMRDFSDAGPPESPLSSPHARAG